ncbi:MULTISPECIES: lytic polysaccharide monooxygenase [Actinoplanes]|uniref:lytic polysaccharide monooxygenase n=1 Tax=Actinoplanes TaxID=1865 RepID=UPI000695FC37|nr:MULTISPECIES: lytic polysaccharide monooxygenase [Actinoplanes]GLY00309.1 hypothetical protein Acsp01_06880 [Actinoplanes sp. NBRC 101535]
MYLLRRLAAAGLLAAVAVPALPSPALAHGAPTTPISRSAACAGNGTDTGAAACKAAKKATGGFIGAYDNLRLANVTDDRDRVPDGKLCSGGLDLYRGLDLARDDFPSTKVKSGQRLSVSYRGTIPHQGEFRLYLTKAGYDPAKKLTWDDLGSKPLAAITDPPLTGGAYRMKVTLPQRTGHHLLYVVWETSSTPDTYYSCSDLIFPAAAVASPSPSEKPSPTPSEKPSATATPVKTRAAVTPSSPSASAVVQDPVLASGQSETGLVKFGHWLIVGAFAVSALAVAGAGVARLRRRRNH